MDERLASLLDFGADLQAKHDYPRTPAAFARATRIRLVPGTEDSANAGPPAVVTYNTRFGLSYRRFSLWHEVAHVLMGWHGIDADFEFWLDEGDGEVMREKTANQLAGLLMVPRPFMTRALKAYGFTPAAVLELQELSGMSEAICLRQLVHHDPHASRAAAVFLGSQVVDVTMNNYRVPFKRYERVPEPALTVRHAKLQTVRKARLMAVWEE